MKLFIFIAFVAVPVFSAPASHPQESSTFFNNNQLLGNEVRPQYVDLKRIFDTMIAMLDSDGMTAFVSEKLQSDHSAQAVLAYLRGPEGRTINTNFWKDAEFSKLILWLYENGLTNIYNDINTLHTFLEWTLVYPPAKLSRTQSNSLKSLLEEFSDLYSYDFYRSGRYFLELMLTGDESAIALLNRMKQPEMKQSWQAFKAPPEFQNMIQLLRTEGIEIDQLIFIIEQLLGWSC